MDWLERFTPPFLGRVAVGDRYWVLQAGCLQDLDLARVHRGVVHPQEQAAFLVPVRQRAFVGLNPTACQLSNTFNDILFRATLDTGQLYIPFSHP